MTVTQAILCLGVPLLVACIAIVVESFREVYR